MGDRDRDRDGEEREGERGGYGLTTTRSHAT